MEEDQNSDSSSTKWKKRVAKMETKTRQHFERLLVKITGGGQAPILSRKIQKNDFAQEVKESTEVKVEDEESGAQSPKQAMNGAAQPQQLRRQSYNDELTKEQTVESFPLSEQLTSFSKTLAMDGGQEKSGKKRGRKTADLEEYCQNTQKSIDELKVKLFKCLEILIKKCQLQN